MAMKSLSQFQKFSLEDFLEHKQIVFVKALPWYEGTGDAKTIEGCKIVVQIVDDSTKYSKAEISNFGEQLTVKVRNIAPAAYQKFRPLQTRVTISDVEKVSIYGDYRDKLSITAVVQPAEVANDVKK